MPHPQIIQGCPDIAISHWGLARAVAQAGQLGVISGAALAVCLARRLQLGDPEGRFRHAFDHFPFQSVARRVWQQFFVVGGKPESAPFELTRQPILGQGRTLVELTVLANYAEVFLAKEDHGGLVGIRYPGHAPIPLLPSLYGALLAGVDYVLVAGMPTTIPGILDRLTEGDPASTPVRVRDERGPTPHDASVWCGFDPGVMSDGPVPALPRPRMIALVSSASAAVESIRATDGPLDGVVLAGGAPTADQYASPSIDALRSLGVPFWIGVAADPAQVRLAQAMGARGVMVESPFTFAQESSLTTHLKDEVIKAVQTASGDVFGEIPSSAAGQLMKVIRLRDTASDSQVFDARPRICDVGYFRQVYLRPDGTMGYRCPGEPLVYYAEKGGSQEDAVPQHCLCNGLLASAGLGQIQSGRDLEKALVPAGEDVSQIRRFLRPGCRSYTTREVIDELLRPA